MSRADEPSPLDEAPGPDVTNWRSGRVAVRCTAEWAEWLGGLSTFCDVPASQILAQSVYRFAEAVGYNRRPPPRLRNVDRPYGPKDDETDGPARPYA